MPSDAAAGPASRDIVIEILRYRSETDQKPVPQAYRVPFTDDTVPDSTGRSSTAIAAVSPAPRIGCCGTHLDA